MRPYSTSRKSNWYVDPELFYHARYYCLQYRRWKREEGQIKDEQSERKKLLRERCEGIEAAAREADEAIAEWLLDAATSTEQHGYNYEAMHGMPCGRNYYLQKRRKFYWLISERIK